jgi:predicted cobalt transporter CbtA
MTRESFDELRCFRQPDDHEGSPAHRRRRRLFDEAAELDTIVHGEGWLTPPAEVTRVALRPWQQAVFWGLRVYIVVMLVVMGIGFAHVAGGN